MSLLQFPHPHPSTLRSRAPSPGDVSVEELLGTLGLWGCLWSALQGLPLELHTLLDASWAAPVLLPFLGFAAAMFAFYRCLPRPCLHAASSQLLALLCLASLHLLTPKPALASHCAVLLH